MFKFFRSIRQKLISENRLKKYFLYAIGEILLVVVGILIALQLNNLNEAKKDRVYEVKMLNELKLALESDISHSENLIERLNETDSAVKAFISLKHKGYEIKDSLILKPFNEILWGKLRIGVDYRINFGPYEAIKSSGLDKISNDSLRNTLVKFYDFELLSFIELTQWYNRDFNTYLARQNSFLADPIITEKNGELIIEKKIPWDLYKRPNWLNLINDIGNTTKWNRNRLNWFIPKMKEMARKIESEIVE